MSNMEPNPPITSFSIELFVFLTFLLVKEDISFNELISQRNVHTAFFVTIFYFIHCQKVIISYL